MEKITLNYDHQTPREQDDSIRNKINELVEYTNAHSGRVSKDKNVRSELSRDWELLIKDLMLFVESNGDVCNGFRTRETILEMKRRITQGNDNR